MHVHSNNVAYSRSFCVTKYLKLLYIYGRLCQLLKIQQHILLPAYNP